MLKGKHNVYMQLHVPRTACIMFDGRRNRTSSKNQVCVLFSWHCHFGQASLDINMETELEPLLLVLLLLILDVFEIHMGYVMIIKSEDWFLMNAFHLGPSAQCWTLMVVQCMGVAWGYRSKKLCRGQMGQYHPGRDEV